MKVGFFRHGPAAPRGTAGISEIQRPLTAEGREKTEEAANGLRQLDLGFDAVFASPLTRAQQTAEIVAGVLRLSRPRPLELLRPSTSARRLLDGLRGLGVKSPLLVGHEPLLSLAISEAIGAGAKGSLEMKKAGLALLEFPKSLTRPSGTLKLLLAPSVLRRLGRS